MNPSKAQMPTSFLFMQTLLLTAVCFVSPGWTMSQPEPSKTQPGTSVALYALSRGKGVPERTQAALDHAREMLEAAKREGKVVRLVQQRIGIEGETRLCAEFVNREHAQAMLERLNGLMKGIELMNIVAEACHDR